MNKAEKIILILAPITFIIGWFMPQPEEGSVLEIIRTSFTVMPVIIAIIILARHRSDPTVPLILRILGYLVIALWISSFFFRG